MADPVLDAPTGLDALRLYAEWTIEKRELESRAKALAEQIEQVTPAVLSHFEMNGIQSVTLDDATVYLRTEHWPSKLEACEGLTNMEIRQRFLEADLGIYCEPRINVQGLRAHFGEAMKQAQSRAKAERRNAAEIEPEDVIPDALKGVIGIKTVNKIGARRRG